MLLGVSSDVSWKPVGSLLGRLGGLLAVHGGLLGRLGCFFLGASSWGPLGVVILGASWGLLGASWGPLGVILGASPWGFLGASWGHLGRGRSTKGAPPIISVPLLREPPNSPPGPLLGRSWSALGRSWGRLGALLGPSWGPLGPSWSHLEASDGHRKRNGEKAKMSGFLKVLNDFLRAQPVI